jgi:hypothetical protein
VNSDFRIEIGFLDNPKTIRLLRECGPEGIISLLRLWGWVAVYRINGNLDGLDAQNIEEISRWKNEPGKFYNSLKNGPWIDGDELHEWKLHQPYVVKAIERIEKSRKAGKASGIARRSTRSSTMSSTRSSTKIPTKTQPPTRPDPTRPDHIQKEENKGRFTPPSIEEVTTYCKERGNVVDARRFIDFYEAKGWMIGKNKMKSWKAAVRTWEQNEQNNPRINKPSPTPITDIASLARKLST